MRGDGATRSLVSFYGVRCRAGSTPRLTLHWRARDYYTARGPVVRLIRAKRAGTGVKWARKGSQRYEGLNWTDHRHTVLHRHFLWRFPTFERPPAKLPPFEGKQLARVPSWPFPPRPNARPHSHRNVRPITRFALLETSHLGTRNLDGVPFSCCPITITMTAARQYH
jgi:hypothetical protein